MIIDTSTTNNATFGATGATNDNVVRFAVPDLDPDIGKALELHIPEWQPFADLRGRARIFFGRGRAMFRRALPAFAGPRPIVEARARSNP